MSTKPTSRWIASRLRPSDEQMNFLIDYMEKNVAFANGQLDFVANRSMWEELSEILNNLDSNKTRPMEHWKKTWNELKSRCEKKCKSLDRGEKVPIKPMIQRVCRIMGLSKNITAARPAQSTEGRITRSRQQNVGEGLPISDVKVELSDPEPHTSPTSPIIDATSSSSLPSRTSPVILAKTSAAPQASKPRGRKRDSTTVDLTVHDVESSNSQDDEPPAKKAFSQGMSTQEFIEHVDKMNEKYVAIFTEAMREIKDEIKNGIQRVLNKMDELSQKNS